MPDAQLMGVGASLLADARAGFTDIYELKKQDKLIAAVQSCFETVPMDYRSERLWYWESLPNVERWDYKTAMPEGSTSQKSFSINAYKYGKRVSWDDSDARHENSRAGSGVVNWSQGLASNLAYLDVRVFAQMIQAATNFKLLKEGVGTCPDGAALYAATAGGLDRFGVSGGNIIASGSGVTAAGIETDIFAAYERAMGFLHTSPDGENPVHDPISLKKMYIFHPLAITREMAKAVMQTRVANVVSGSATDAGGLTNILQEYGLVIEPIPFPYLTDANDYYIFFPDAGKASLLKGVMNGEDVRTFQFDPSNDRHSAINDEATFGASTTRGYRYGLPLTTMKVVNS